MASSLLEAFRPAGDEPDFHLWYQDTPSEMRFHWTEKVSFMAGNMNSGGRNRKSAKIKVIEGGRGHRKIEPEIEATGAPKMPDYFNGEQRAFWNETVACMPADVFKTADSALLERFVLASLRLREAERIVADAGLLVAGAQGITRNPALMIVTVAEKQVVALSDRLGLSPAARTRLHIGKGKDDEGMEWLLN